MANLRLTPRTTTIDLLEAFPEAESVLGWYGDDGPPEDGQTLAQFARACGLDVKELLIDLKASLSLSDESDDDDDPERFDASSFDEDDYWDDDEALEGGDYGPPPSLVASVR